MLFCFCAEVCMYTYMFNNYCRICILTLIKKVPIILIIIILLVNKEYRLRNIKGRLWGKHTICVFQQVVSVPAVFYLKASPTHTQWWILLAEKHCIIFSLWKTKDLWPDLIMSYEHVADWVLLLVVNEVTESHVLHYRKQLSVQCCHLHYVFSSGTANV